MTAKTIVLADDHTIVRSALRALLEAEQSPGGGRGGRRRGRGGLTGMRERARLLGGELVLETAPGRGTVIRVAFPAVHRLPDLASPPRIVPRDRTA